MKSFVKTLQYSNQQSESENRLFCAVIYQAIDDASYKGLDKRYLRYKQEAIDWLTNMSNDFCLVCQLANYEPQYVKDQIKKLAMHGSIQFTQAQNDILFNGSIKHRTVLSLIP